MQFLDFGNMQIIEIYDIRRIPEALLFDCVTITADCISHCKCDPDKNKILSLNARLSF